MQECVNGFTGEKCEESICNPKCMRGTCGANFLCESVSPLSTGAQFSFPDVKKAGAAGTVNVVSRLLAGDLIQASP